MKKVICITGPTASGKSDLAFYLAKKLSLEIISCDSVSVYEKLNIGAAKPSDSMLSEVKHYLVSTLDLKNKFDVSLFQNKAREIINNSNDVKIVCGGTGLYLNALIYDYNLTHKKRDINFEIEYKDLSNLELHDLLKKYDYNASLKIHFNNRIRVLRALEIAMNNDLLISDNKTNTLYYDAFIIYIDIPKELLDDRIYKRTKQMFDMNLEKEVYDLYKKNILINAIGYKEFYPYFNGEITKDDVFNQIVKNTKYLAKKQKTWFKNKTNAKFYSISDSYTYKDLYDDVYNDVLNFLKK